MMNLIAISLVTTSLVVSGLFSPTPQNSGGGKDDQVIVKGGHRAVVVEYADDVGDGNTKVFISKQEPGKGPGLGPNDDQLSRAAASVAGVAQDVKGTAQEVLTGQSGPHGARPRELICDAYGRCKHKIAGMWDKAKQTAAEAEDAVEEVVDKAKGFASKAGDRVEESAECVTENAKEKVRKAGESVERVKEKTGEKVRETGEMAREKVEKVKGKAGEMAGKTGEMVEETGEMIKEKGKKGKKELTDIAKRGKDVIFDTIWYVCATLYVVGKEAMSSILGVMQLMGFAIAYGTAIWVTFIMSHVLASVLPRQQFGMVQSKVYPMYFRVMVGSIGLALLGHLLGQRGKEFRSNADMLQGYNLMTSLLFVLGNLLFLEPRATKVMFDRMKLEKEEGRGRDHVNASTRVTDTVVSETAGPHPTTTSTTTTAAPTTTTPSGRPKGDEAKNKLAGLDNRLKKLNTYSSLLNIMTLMGLTWHLVYLSQRLRVEGS